MKIFLTGASGLLGRSVYERFLSETNWNVCGISFKRQVPITYYYICSFIYNNIQFIFRTSPGLTKLNLLDKDAVTNLLNTVCPDMIIHCAAERFPDKVEGDPQAAYDLNVGVSAHIADIASIFELR